VRVVGLDYCLLNDFVDHELRDMPLQLCVSPRSVEDDSLYGRLG
jgi:hypothetical protein